MTLNVAKKIAYDAYAPKKSEFNVVACKIQIGVLACLSIRNTAHCKWTDEKCAG